MFNVGSLLSQVNSSSKNVDGNKTAVIFKDKKFTYYQLNSLSNRLANKFLELGIQKGDRIAALLYNCAEYWEVYFACAKIGAILVPLNFRLAPPELEFALKDSDPRILVFGEPFRKMVRELEPRLSGVKYYFRLLGAGETTDLFTEDLQHLDYERLYEAKENEPEAEINLEDDLFIMYTSGTTGRPKGAVWTHSNSLWFSVSQIISLSFKAEDITLLSGPMYHVGSLQDMSMPTFHMVGTCVLLPSRGANSLTVLQLMEHERVTKALLFPIMLYDILALRNLNEYDLSSLKTVFTGGEPVPIASIRRFQEQFPKVDLVQLYGLTEGGGIATGCLPEYAVEKAGSAGKPLLNVDLKISDDAGNSLEPGQIAEVLVKSPAVSKGYWRRPDANAEIFVKGWCRTGDLGRLDKDGFLYLEGRKKDMIISGAENIYPAEIENVLFQHPKIHDAAVIGVPDARWGEAVVAVIVTKPGESISPTEVIEHCKGNLAGYKKPRHVVFIDSLPRTPSQKVQKYILRDRFKNLGES